MFQQIIDRRLSGKNKSIGNRERFLRRYKDQIKGAVRRAIDGRGIRDLTSMGSATLILAGPADDKRDFKLFVLSGNKVSNGPKVDFGDMHVEGVASGTDGSLLFVSDDGDKTIGGTACKDLPDSERRFRTLTVKP